MRIAKMFLAALLATQAPVTPPSATPTPAAPAAPAAALTAAAPPSGATTLVSMKDFMVKIIYPYSDTLFYVEREDPKIEGDWMALETKALTLAEMGNLMMTPGRARDQDQWMKDAQLLVTVANKAYKAAQAKNLQAMVDLNAELYESCQSCHVHYRPGYRRRQ